MCLFQLTPIFRIVSIFVITDLDFSHFLFQLVMGLSQEGPVVVVVDGGNHRLVLWRLGDDGTVWKQLGSQGTEPGQFYLPQAVALTSTGALVVTDRHRVQVLTVDGAVVCVLDPTAVASVGRLGQDLYGVTVCADTDGILVTDLHNHRVVALTWSPPSQVRLFSIFFQIYFFSSCNLPSFVLKHVETSCVGCRALPVSWRARGPGAAGARRSGN
jgi:hypothetical protein